MKRGWRIAILVLVILLVLGGVGLWGLWAATGRGAPAYEAIAWMCEDSGSYSSAARWYKRAAARRPNDGHLRYKYAEALWRSGDVSAALKQYEEAERLEPTWTWPLIHKANAQLYLGELDEAAATLDTLRAIAPNDGYVEYYTGRLRAAEGKTEEAYVALEGALSRDPELAEAYGELGKLFEDQGDADRAVRYYEDGARRGNAECANRLAALGQTPPSVTQPASPGTQQPQSPGAPGAPSAASSGTPSPSASGSGAAPPPAFFGVMGGFMLMYVVFIFGMIVFSMAAWVAQILAIYDCARRDFDDPTGRAIWCIVLVLTNWIGALMYYILVYRKDDPRIQQTRPTVGVPAV